MILSSDYHTHTVYSHGKGQIIDNARVAKEKGLIEIGISDHGFSHPAFGMRRKKLAKMRRECTLAEQKTGVKVLLGIESNIRGKDGSIDVIPNDYDKLDVVLAGVHKFIFYKTIGDFFRLLVRNMLHDKFKMKATDRLIKYNTECYINVIKNNPIDVLTHVGFGCKCDAEAVAKVAKEYGTAIEISTKKTHLSDEEWKKVIATGVNFVIDSDAHSTDRIGDVALAEDLFSRVEFPMERILNIDGKIPKLRFAKFKEERGIK